MAPPNQPVTTVNLSGVPCRALSNGDGTYTLLVVPSDASADIVGSAAAPIITTPGTSETAFAALPALAAFMDSATLQPVGRVRTIYVLVTTAFAWVTSGQAKLQLYVGRTSFAAAGGASSQLDALHPVVGTAQNLGASGTALAINSLFAFSPASIAELQWYHPFIGVELTFPSTPSVGVATVYVESYA